MRRLPPIVIVLFVCALARLPEGAHSAPLGDPDACATLASDKAATVLDFDHRRADEVLTGQYDGVKFGETAVASDPPMGAHSGSFGARSIDQGDDLRSAGRPVLMRFDRPQQAVGLYVGREDPDDTAGPARVRLTGYGTNGFGTTSVFTTAEIELAPEPIRISRCLSIEAPAGTGFSSATLEYMTGDRRSLAESRWLDDLTLVPAASDVPFAAAPIGIESIGEPPQSRIEPTPDGGSTGPPWVWIALAGLGLAVMCGSIAGWTRTGPAIAAATSAPDSPFAPIDLQHRDVEEMRAEYDALYGRRRAA